MRFPPFIYLNFLKTFHIRIHYFFADVNRRMKKAFNTMFKGFFRY
ncbi:hypothetical protein D2M30_1671 [Bacillus amyloliquefaciens]|nr:hypothetical protein D2M30_1671 [Bacillus amyloliquefaciens]